MKLIAHRGWSAGRDENTLEAFATAARDERLSGVEFDVWRDPRSDTFVVSHDRPAGGEETKLTLDAALSFLSGTDLELFVEIKQAGIAEGIIEKVVDAGTGARSVVFAIEEVAKTFPWIGTRSTRLGIIVPYPWNIARLVNAHRPDVILLGFDERAWTRIAFRAWWSVFSLERLGGRHSAAVVVGVAQRSTDLQWLLSHRIYAVVADMPA